MRKLNYVCAVMLITVLILSFIYPALATEEEFTSGSGDKDDPYIITTASELSRIRDHMTGHFRLEKDIDFDDGELWDSIGNPDDPFMGSLDGNNHKITGLKINSSDDVQTHFGLFGYVSEGEIKNLQITDSEIVISRQGENDGWKEIYAASVAAVIDHSVIENCSSSGSVVIYSKDYFNNAAGICAGAKNDSRIVKAFNSGNISAFSEENVSVTAGICAEVTDSRIENCCNSGTITSSSGTSSLSLAGGIAGEVVEMTDAQASVSHCVNTGKIYIFGSDIHAGDSFTGAASGIVSSVIYGDISYCYYLDNSLGVGNNKGNSTVNEVTGLSREQMKDPANYKNLSDEIWILSEGNLPLLEGLPYMQGKVVSLEILSAEKTNYIEGDEFSPEGILKVIYSDGTTEEISFADAEVFGFDSDSAGEKNMTVFYGGLYERFTVTVEHDYEEEETAPTCTEWGETVYTCTLCGDTYTVKTEPLGHTEEIISERVEATCTENGATEEIGCSVCGKVVLPSEVIPSTGHAHTPFFNKDEFVYVNICSICGESEEMSGEETVSYINMKIEELISDGISYDDKALYTEIYSAYEALSSEYRDGIIHSYEMVNAHFGLYGRGDIDFDGIIRMTDLSVMLYNYGEKGENIADIDDSGIVDSIDLSALLFGYGVRLEY